ncbi:MAG: 4-hydroxythreonine-4-phosphate dehydrogenase PdxA [Hyphomicrobiales bacterium]|nr:4-hydroxythreonine-4-phosphate dehydrogenase PdxA [Hyphomicrobiales bacterium]
MANPLPLALTIGEPGGVGPDITLAAWMDRDRHNLPPFYCYADRQFLMERAKDLGIACPMESVAPNAAVACFQRALPVVELDAAIESEPGQAEPRNAGAVIEAIAKAVGDIRAGLAGGIVTNPINKKALYEAGFRHPGHTEFLGTLSAAWTGKRGRPVMMLVGPDLRTVPVTIHIPHRDVAGALSQGSIVETSRTVASDLRRRFGIAHPRLAIAGLNPHAGEAGSLGDEERETIEPAILSLRADGLSVTGPHSADALFHPAARANYDAAICMYHDQALIPAKTISFSETVNVTLGLAFIRTSPDHGTALDIAGSGRADPSSLAAALRLAAELRRNESVRSDG